MFAKRDVIANEQHEGFDDVVGPGPFGTDLALAARGSQQDHRQQQQAPETHIQKTCLVMPSSRTLSPIGIFHSGKVYSSFGPQGSCTSRVRESAMWSITTSTRPCRSSACGLTGTVADILKTKRQRQDRGGHELTPGARRRIARYSQAKKIQ